MSVYDFLMVPCVGLRSVNVTFPGHSVTRFLFVILTPCRERLINSGSCNTCTVHTNVSPAGKGLTSWLLFVMFNWFFLLFHVVSWVRRDI